jgi:hypothetical protein
MLNKLDVLAHTPQLWLANGRLWLAKWELPELEHDDLPENKSKPPCASRASVALKNASLKKLVPIHWHHLQTEMRESNPCL